MFLSPSVPLRKEEKKKRLSDSFQLFSKRICQDMDKKEEEKRGRNEAGKRDEVDLENKKREKVLT